MKMSSALCWENYFLENLEISFCQINKASPNLITNQEVKMPFFILISLKVTDKIFP